jgi:hypothetical protein
MSEIDLKREQYRDLLELKESAGWMLLHQQMSIRQVADQLKLADSPDTISSAMRDWVAGRVKGTADTINLLDLLLDGLKSEIEHLQEQETNNAGPDNAASDDADLSGASSANPLGS